MQIIVKQKEELTGIKKILEQIDSGLTTTFKSSFLNYAELLAETVSKHPEEYAKVLAESKRVSEEEFKVIREGLQSINTRIDAYLVEAQKELEAAKLHREKETKFLEKLDKEIYGY